MSSSSEKHASRKELAITAAVTWVLVWLGFFTSPGLFESIDWILFYQPNFHFLRDSLGSGEIPWWNPYIGLGRPFLADLQNAVFYPPIYLLLLGDLAGTFLIVWLHAILAVAGVVWLGRRFEAPFAHSLVLGCCLLLAAQFSGRLLAGQLMYWCAACYMPLLLAQCHGLTERWSWRAVAGLALTFFLQVLCGHPQIFWISSIGVGLYGLGLTFHLKASWGARAKIPAQLAVALAWSFVLAAFVLLPFAELVGQGNRSASSLEFAGYHSLDWKDLAGLVRPPVVDWEKNAYVGFVMAGLGLLALIKAKIRLPILFLIAFGFVFALGNNTPLFKLFYYGLPGTSGFRIPGRMVLLVAVALIVGALMVSGVTRRKKLLFGLLLFAAFELGMETFRLKRLYTFSSVAQESSSFPVYTNTVKILATAGLLKEGAPPPRVHLQRGDAPSNFAMYGKYSSTDAYTSLFLKRPWDYLHLSLGVEPPVLKNTYLNDEVYRKAFPYEDLDQVLAFRNQTNQFVLHTNASSRVFLAHQAEVKEYAAIPAGDWSETNVFVEDPSLASLGGEVNQGRVRITSFGGNRIEIAYETPSDALLVLREAYYPGWKLNISGQEIESVPVNGWMRGFPVPAGTNGVAVVYEPNYLAAGAGISAAGFLILIFAWKKGAKPGRQAP